MSKALSGFPLRGYVLCTTPRSGSNFLCDLLAKTGVLGNPLEYFNAPGRRLVDTPDYPDQPKKQIDIVLTRGLTPNGIFGLKVFPAHIDALKDFHWIEALPPLTFIYLRRTDVLGQAISAVIANQTRRWRSTMPIIGGSSYNSAEISRMLSNIVQWDARWRLYFALQGMSPLELVYEDVWRDPGSAVSGIAKAVGVSLAAGQVPLESSLTIQRDSTNETWRARYLRECRNTHVIPALGGA